MSKIRIDFQGFVWDGNFRLPMRYDAARGVLIFHDKDKRRSERRGSPVIEVPLALLAIDLVSMVPGEPGQEAGRVE